VERPKRQGECSHEDGKAVCCEYTLGHGWTPVFAFAHLLATLGIAYYVLPAYFSHRS
jgi:hypothetical protein